MCHTTINFKMLSSRNFLLICFGVAVTCVASAASTNATASEWQISCTPQNSTIVMYTSANVTCDIQGPEKAYSEHTIIVHSNNPDVIEVKNTEVWLKKEKDTQYYPESFNVYGVFIGQTNVSVQIRRKHDAEPEATENLNFIVIRKMSTLDIVFHVSVIGLITLMYVNFGAAFNWGALKENMRRPVVPILGFGIQVICMPLISFMLGRLIFPDNVPMQLGLFFSGIVPSGGASNMWTLILGGNLDLSITLTTMSTLAAFASMPFWIFTLGRVIYHDGNMSVPYTRIMHFSMCLIIPLFVGYLIQRFLPRLSQFLVRILKGLSGALLAFIIVFAMITQAYIFKLFSWKIVLAGMCLPWSGYILAFSIAKLCGREHPDVLAIAVETGIQNTGIAIGLLKTTLLQPAGDLTVVVPVAVAVMTPFPLLAVYLYQMARRRIQQKESATTKKRGSVDN